MSAAHSVKFILGNRSSKVICSSEVMIMLKKRFRFHPEGYFFSKKFRLGIWNGWIQMLQRGTIATGLLLDKLEGLKKNFDVEVKDNRVFPKFK